MEFEKACEDFRRRIREGVREPTFLGLTASGRQRNRTVPWEKVTVRPVEVRGERRMQFSRFDGRKDLTANYDPEEGEVQVEGVLEAPFANFHVQAMTGDLHVRITKRGKVFVTEGRPSRGAGDAEDLSHNLAAYAYLVRARGVRARVEGVDENGELVRKCGGLAQDLGWEEVTFREAGIGEYEPEAPPDVTMSLHACDTATDEALAKGVTWESTLIVAAPCCQRELRGQVDSEAMRPLLRHGILKARTADLVTDAVRALLLRIAGYRTEVMEFVSPEHTAKNLLIRAERGLERGDPGFVREYRRWKAFWGIEPSLERMLGERISPRPHGLEEHSGCIRSGET